MNAYEYMASRKTTPLDFLDVLTNYVKQGIYPHYTFKDIARGVNVKAYGLNAVALKAILRTIKDGRDHGLDPLVLDVTDSERGTFNHNNQNYEEESIPTELLLPLKSYSLMSLYKELRKYTTKYLASRAVIIVVTHYLRALQGRNDV